MTTHSYAVRQAANRLQEFLEEAIANYPGFMSHTESHDLKANFALLRNGAELWARAKDKEEA